MNTVTIDINNPFVGRNTLFDKGAILALLQTEGLIEIIDSNNVVALGGLDSYVMEKSEFGGYKNLYFHRSHYFIGKDRFSLRDLLKWYRINIKDKDTV